jgi:signal transduction histidine kinase
MFEKASRLGGLSRIDLLHCAAFGATYFFAVRAGEHLYGSLRVPSPFWLPDSVLLCALLLIPRRLWWTVFLVAWPIRLLAGVPQGTPLWFWLTSIVNDSVKALLAAWLLQRVLGRTVRLNTFREFLIFLAVAAAGVPLLSATAAAPARHTLGDPLWRAGYQWFMGDALTQVIVTPTLLYWCTRASGRVTSRPTESALLLVGLNAALYYTFVASHGDSSPALLYMPVPFLIWAAVRLGPPAAANANALVSVIAVFGTVNATGVLAGHSPDHALLSIQCFLVLLAVSSLSLAIVAAERERRTQELEALLDAVPITVLIATDTDFTSVRTNRTSAWSPQSPGAAFPTKKSWLQRAAAVGVPVSGEVLTYVSDDGTERHTMSSAAPLIGEDGKLRGAIGAFMDITERKSAEEQVQELTGRLIGAQDEERARIARELHDDVSQQLAVLQISVDRLRQSADGLSSDDRRQLDTIADVTSQCASSLHQLSHRLHPETLDLLGLVDIVAGLCRQFRTQQGTNVQFVHRDVPKNLDKAVKVCLVRIVQEALRNVVTHSGVTDATVELSGHDAGIELSISDAGRGFDLDSARKVPGLGLVSMRERLRPLGGRLVVESEPLRGTRIQASVPLEPRVTTDGRRPL